MKATRLSEHQRDVIARAIRALTDAGVLAWTDNCGTPETEITLTISSIYPHVVLEITSGDRTAAKFRVPSELENYFEHLYDAITET